MLILGHFDQDPMFQTYADMELIKIALHRFLEQGSVCVTDEIWFYKSLCISKTMRRPHPHGEDLNDANVGVMSRKKSCFKLVAAGCFMTLEGSDIVSWDLWRDIFRSNLSGYPWRIASGSNWPTIYSRRFQMHFHEWRVLFPNSNLTELLFEVPIDNKSALDKEVVCNWICEKPLVESITTQFTDAYISYRPQFVRCVDLLIL